MSNIFENATKAKFRFVHGIKGRLSTEDLWDLSLKELDAVGIGIQKEIADMGEITGLLPEAKESSHSLKKGVLGEKLEIVKHVINCKVTESRERESAAQTAERTQTILKIIQEKQGDELKNKSVEELQAMIAGS